MSEPNLRTNACPICGKPTEQGLLQDGAAAYDFAAARYPSAAAVFLVIFLALAFLITVVNRLLTKPALANRGAEPLSDLSVQVSVGDPVDPASSPD